ncbi:MAG: hypothetical protein ACE5FM_02585 [Methyloligellaceae bacterium]
MQSQKRQSIVKIIGARLCRPSQVGAWDRKGADGEGFFATLFGLFGGLALSVLGGGGKLKLPEWGNNNGNDNGDPFEGAFMQPVVIYDTFWTAETIAGREVIPSDVAESANEAASMMIDTPAHGPFKETGWWARLSAPGYLDATDWSGPFDTEDAAMDALIELYGD